MVYTCIASHCYHPCMLHDNPYTIWFSGKRNNPEERGVIPNSFDHIFTHISRTHDEQYLVRSSYLEIYQEEIRDLLSKDHKKRLELRERPDTGIYVKVCIGKMCLKFLNQIQNCVNRFGTQPCPVSMQGY